MQIQHEDYYSNASYEKIVQSKKEHKQDKKRNKVDHRKGKADKRKDYL